MIQCELNTRAVSAGAPRHGSLRHFLRRAAFCLGASLAAGIATNAAAAVSPAARAALINF